MNFVLIHVLCLRALFVKFVPILTKVFYGLVVDFYFWRGTLIFCIISVYIFSTNFARISLF